METKEIDGITYEPVFACELEVGDVTLLNGRVAKVERFTTPDGAEKVSIEFHDGQFVKGYVFATYEAAHVLLAGAA